jgi:hypothetical protein
VFEVPVELPEPAEEPEPVEEPEPDDAPAPLEAPEPLEPELAEPEELEPLEPEPAEPVECALEPEEPLDDEPDALEPLPDLPVAVLSPPLVGVLEGVGEVEPAAETGLVMPPPSFGDPAKAAGASRPNLYDAAIKPIDARPTMVFVVLLTRQTPQSEFVRREYLRVAGSFSPC